MPPSRTSAAGRCVLALVLSISSASAAPSSGPLEGNITLPVPDPNDPLLWTDTPPSLTWFDPAGPQVGPPPVARSAVAAVDLYDPPLAPGDWVALPKGDASIDELPERGMAPFPSSSSSLLYVSQQPAGVLLLVGTFVVCGPNTTVTEVCPIRTASSPTFENVVRGGVLASRDGGVSWTLETADPRLCRTDFELVALRPAGSAVDVAVCVVGGALLPAAAWDIRLRTPTASVLCSPDGRTWTEQAPLPEPVKYAGVAAANTTIVVTGGRRLPGSSFSTYASVTTTTNGTSNSSSGGGVVISGWVDMGPSPWDFPGGSGSSLAPLRYAPTSVFFARPAFKIDFGYAAPALLSGVGWDFSYTPPQLQQDMYALHGSDLAAFGAALESAAAAGLAAVPRDANGSFPYAWRQLMSSIPVGSDLLMRSVMLPLSGDMSTATALFPPSGLDPEAAEFAAYAIWVSPTGASINPGLSNAKSWLSVFSTDLTGPRPVPGSVRTYGTGNNIRLPGSIEASPVRSWTLLQSATLGFVPAPAPPYPNGGPAVITTADGSSSHLQPAVYMMVYDRLLVGFTSRCLLPTCAAGVEYPVTCQRSPWDASCAPCSVCASAATTGGGGSLGPPQYVQRACSYSLGINSRVPLVTDTVCATCTDCAAQGLVEVRPCSATADAQCAAPPALDPSGLVSASVSTAFGRLLIGISVLSALLALFVLLQSGVAAVSAAHPPSSSHGPPRFKPTAERGLAHSSLSSSLAPSPGPASREDSLSTALTVVAAGEVGLHARGRPTPPPPPSSSSSPSSPTALAIISPSVRNSDAALRPPRRYTLTDGSLGAVPAAATDRSILRHTSTTATVPPPRLVPAPLPPSLRRFRSETRGVSQPTAVPLAPAPAQSLELSAMTSSRSSSLARSDLRRSQPPGRRRSSVLSLPSSTGSSDSGSRRAVVLREVGEEGSGIWAPVVIPASAAALLGAAAASHERYLPALPPLPPPPTIADTLRAVISIVKPGAAGSRHASLQAAVAAAYFGLLHSSSHILLALGLTPGGLRESVAVCMLATQAVMGVVAVTGLGLLVRRALQRARASAGTEAAAPAASSSDPPAPGRESTRSSVSGDEASSVESTTSSKLSLPELVVAAGGVYRGLAAVLLLLVALHPRCVWLVRLLPVSLPAHFVMRLESFAGRVAWAGEAVQLVLVSVLLSSPPVPAYRWGQLVTVCVLVGGAGVAFGVGTCLVRRPSGLVRRTVWIGERGPETGTSGPSQTAGAGTGARGDDEEMAVFASPLRSGSSVATGASSAGIGAAESRTRSRPSTQTSSSSSTHSTSTRASRVMRASRTSEAEVEAEGPLRGADDDDDDNVESDDDGMRSAAIVDPAQAARTVITLTSESLGDADDGGYGAGLVSEGPVDGRRRPPTRLLTLTEADATATIFTSSSGAFSSLNSSAFPSSASSSAWASTAAARRHRRIASAGRHQLDSAVTAEEEGGGEDDAWPTAAGTADIVVTGDDADNASAAAVGARGRSTAAGRGAHPPPPPLPPRAPASAHIGGGGARDAAEVEAATGGGELEELEEEEGEASLGFSAAAAAAAALEAEFEMEEEEAEAEAAAYAAEISALHEHTNPLRAAMARSARRSVVGLGGGTLAMTRTSSSL
jgi:hypothetical protein